MVCRTPSLGSWNARNGVRSARTHAWQDNKRVAYGGASVAAIAGAMEKLRGAIICRFDMREGSGSEFCPGFRRNSIRKIPLGCHISYPGA